MLKRRRDHGKAPATVNESWRRIEAWLDDHLPVLKETLRPGISKKDVAKFEKLVGRRLPDDVRESWMIHDGQRKSQVQEAEKCRDRAKDGVQLDDLGLLFGHRLMPLLGGDHILTIRSALGNWKMWSGIMDFYAERVEGDGMLDHHPGGRTSSPEGAIRPYCACRAWIPLVEVHESDHIGVDLGPGPKGVVGQVISFGRENEVNYVLAASWAQFLDDFADELEAGNFGISGENDFRVLCMKKPRMGTIYENLRAWSKVKAGSVLGEDS